MWQVMWQIVACPLYDLVIDSDNYDFVGRMRPAAE
jgi:hypothetical protein